MANCNADKLESHQMHILYHPMYTTGFRCEDIIVMEKKHGRHDENCPHVGYIASNKCGCNVNSK